MQLVNNRLLARFPKHAHAEFINLEFVPPDLRKKIEQKSLELLDIKVLALELKSEVYIIKENIHNVKHSLHVKTLRKSLSARNRFPKLVTLFGMNQQEFNIICFRIYGPQIGCDYRFIPLQVIIMEETANLLIFYIGFLSDIHGDANPNILHLPGMSIIVEKHSRYTIEFDLKLGYQEDSERIVMLKQCSVAGTLTGAIHLTKVPDEFRSIDGEKPDILRTLPIKVSFNRAGQLQYYRCVERIPGFQRHFTRQIRCKQVSTHVQLMELQVRCKSFRFSLRMEHPLLMFPLRNNLPRDDFYFPMSYREICRSSD